MPRNVVAAVLAIVFCAIAIQQLVVRSSVPSTPIPVIGTSATDDTPDSIDVVQNTDNYSIAEDAYHIGDFEKAIKFYSAAEKEYADLALYGNRGNCHFQLGNLDAALADYERAINVEQERTGHNHSRRLAYIHYNRGYAYQHSGQFSDAVADYKTTLVLDSDYPDVNNALAWLLATCPEDNIRNPQLALEHAVTAASKAPDDFNVQDTLAACYAATGNFIEAVAHQQTALSNCEDATLKQQLSARLALYEHSTPYLELPQPK